MPLGIKCSTQIGNDAAGRMFFVKCFTSTTGAFRCSVRMITRTQAAIQAAQR
jgi:hypothetical protein